MFITFNIQQLSLRIIKEIPVGCTNGVSVDEVHMVRKNPNKGCFHLFLHPEAGLVRGG